MRASSIAEAACGHHSSSRVLTGAVLAAVGIPRRNGLTRLSYRSRYVALPTDLSFSASSAFCVSSRSRSRMSVRCRRSITFVVIDGPLVPEAHEHFPPPGRVQAINALLDTGAASLGLADAPDDFRYGRCRQHARLPVPHSCSHSRSTVGLPIAVSVVCSAVVAIVIGWALWRYQTHRFVAAVGPDPGRGAVTEAWPRLKRGPGALVVARRTGDVIPVPSTARTRVEGTRTTPRPFESSRASRSKRSGRVAGYPVIRRMRAPVRRAPAWRECAR